MALTKKLFTICFDVAYPDIYDLWMDDNEELVKAIRETEGVAKLTRSLDQKNKFYLFLDMRYDKCQLLEEIGKVITEFFSEKEGNQI